MSFLRGIGLYYYIAMVVPMKADIAGIALSAACLAHCLLLPVAIFAAPALHVWLGETETTLHWLLFGVALVVTGWALYVGFQRHAAMSVVVTGSVGLFLMFAAAAHVFGRPTEAMLTIVGAAVVAAAHLLNVRMCAGCAQAE